MEGKASKVDEKISNVDINCYLKQPANQTKVGLGKVCGKGLGEHMLVAVVSLGRQP